jgi:long-chain acyl-CoA synthetase
MNWHFKAEEAEYILEDSNAKALIIHADLLAQIESGIPDNIEVLVAPTPPEIRDAYVLDPAICEVPGGRRAWDEFIEGFGEWDRPPESNRGIMLYTSGTTGKPKGVQRPSRTPEQEKVYKGAVTRSHGRRTGMRSLLCGPCYHAPLDVQVTIALEETDADLIIQPRFDAGDFLGLVEKHGVTHAHMVPVMFVRLLNLPEEVRKRYDVSTLEHIIHGAAPVAVDVKHAMIDWWGPVLVEYYGGTEIGVVGLATSEQWLRKPGTVGPPPPGAIIKILDENGNELGPGEVGEIYTGNPALNDFTYRGREDERKAIERDGLVTLGDVGYRDEDGWLFISDRRKDMIISGGVNIYPAEIEAALITMPGIAECAVFGIPDKEFGESIMAVVETVEGAEVGEADVRAYLTAHLANYKVPKRIEFQKDLPREETGKIYKRVLREPYWQEAGRAI